MSKLSALWDFSRFSVHGDTQAVFEYEPPQSVLNEISKDEQPPGNIVSENTSVQGDSGGKPQLKRTNTKRKDSMVAVTGFTEHLSEYLHERGADNIAGRLEALEGSTKRIEDMLRKIGQDVGEDDSESGEGLHIPRIDTSEINEGIDSP